jgi:hypothetical protein
MRSRVAETLIAITLIVISLSVFPVSARAQSGANVPPTTSAMGADELQFTLMIWESADQILARTDGARSAKYWQAFADFGVLLQNEGVLRGGSALRTGVRNGRSARVSRARGASAEELGGYFVIAVPSAEDAARWAARVPAALTGVVEVRPSYPAPTMKPGK